MSSPSPLYTIRPRESPPMKNRLVLLAEYVTSPAVELTLRACAEP